MGLGESGCGWGLEWFYWFLKGLGLILVKVKSEVKVLIEKNS